VNPAALNIDRGVEGTVTVPLPRYMAPYRLDLIADLVNTGEWLFVGWLSAFVLHRQQGIAMLGYGHDGSVHQLLELFPRNTGSSSGVLGSVQFSNMAVTKHGELLETRSLRCKGRCRPF